MIIGRVVFYGLALVLAWWAPTWLRWYLLGAASVVAALDISTVWATHRHRQLSKRWRDEAVAGFFDEEREVEHGDDTRQD